MKFGFIGGTPRGFSLMQVLTNHGYKPEFCVILKEDDHENLKVSDKFLEFSQNTGISTSVKKKLSDADYETIKASNLDFIIVCGWRTLIKPFVNDYLKLGMIAAHDSLLPAYRGFAPLNWSIIHGEKQTGVSLFVINDGETDSGDIVLQKVVSIGDTEYAEDVYQKIIDATNAAYLEMMEVYSNSGKLQTYPQDEALATYTCKRTPDDGKIDWQASSYSVYNLIRALAYPYSGAFFYHNNSKYTVKTASIGPQNAKVFSGRIAGRVIAIYEDGIEVLCGEGSVKIHTIFSENSDKEVNAADIFKSIVIKLV